ncbi:MAG: response regulator [Deltaproteobacteria bacterium]|nr:response regulator [Deltaproteobacteria bacterium]
MSTGVRGLSGLASRVLVVDDEPEILNLLVPYIRKLGYAVSEAQDGDHALEKILTERPNVVILDVMMPGLSGWEISRYVRERAELDPVRIIMVTGIGPEANAATSPLYGADAYIDKPFRLETVRKTLESVIQGPARPTA